MEKIQANIVLEILGRPKDNVESAMKNIVNVMNNEKGVKIIEKKFNEAIPAEKSDMFTTFSEILLEFDTLEDLLQFVFKYMPSHVDIVRPESIIFKNNDISSIVNTLSQKMHRYDSIVKNSLAQKEILARKLKEVAPHLFKKTEKDSSLEKEEKKEETKKPKKKSKKKK